MAAHVPLGILLAWVKSWKTPFLTHNHKFGTFSLRGVLSRSGAERGGGAGCKHTCQLQLCLLGLSSSTFPAVLSRPFANLPNTHQDIALSMCSGVPAPRTTSVPLSHASTCVQCARVSLFVLVCLLVCPLSPLPWCWAATVTCRSLRDPPVEDVLMAQCMQGMWSTSLVTARSIAPVSPQG